METKHERVDHANELIRIISSHGRRFFYNATQDRVAHMEVDGRGRVWFIDDYKGKRIYTHYPRHWRGFSHGGTLRDLVIAICEYICKGQKLPRWIIAPQRQWMDGDIWGYGQEAAEAVRAACYMLPIIEPAIQEGGAA